MDAHIQPSDQAKVGTTLTKQVSTAVLTLVADGLAAATTLAQLQHVAKASPHVHLDRVFKGKYNAQDALLMGYADAIMEPFHYISRSKIVEALMHASMASGFSTIAYNAFLSMLEAEGEEGVEMAQAFELLKVPGA
jgi:hypothetical protein